MNWLKSLLGLVSGGGNGGLIGKGLDIVAERTEDADKRNAAIVEILKMQAEAERNPAWLPALNQWDKLTIGARFSISLLIAASAAHLLGRVLLWGVVAVVGIEAMKSGQISIQDFAAIAAGPALYTLAKGRGK